MKGGKHVALPVGTCCEADVHIFNRAAADSEVITNAQIFNEDSRNSRSIARWGAQQAVWARQQSNISRKMHRPVPELAMSTVRGMAL